MRNNFSSLIGHNEIYFEWQQCTSDWINRVTDDSSHPPLTWKPHKGPSAEALTLHIYNFNFWSASWQVPFKKCLGVFGLVIFIIYYKTSSSEAGSVSAAAILMLAISFPFFVSGYFKYCKFHVTTDLTRPAIKSYSKGREIPFSGRCFAFDTFHILGFILLLTH